MQSIRCKQNISKASNIPQIQKIKLVSILPAIFWQKQIGWNYCAGSRRFGLVA